MVAPARHGPAKKNPLFVFAAPARRRATACCPVAPTRPALAGDCQSDRARDTLGILLREQACLQSEQPRPARDCRVVLAAMLLARTRPSFAMIRSALLADRREPGDME